MGGSLTLGRIRGIPIRAHFTLLIILPYLAVLMSARFAAVAEIAGIDPSRTVIPPVVWGVLLAVLLFACILAHELGHSMVATSAGGKVSGITLMLLGGVSEIQKLPKSPGVEAKVAIVGPLVSLAIALVGLGLHRVLDGPPDLLFGLYYLGSINLVVAIFNLLPAFPMDGGRVLRALLAYRFSRVTATRIAAATGTFFAALFVIGGFLVGNLLLALIGLFVWAGARAEAGSVLQEERLDGLSVRDVMRPTHEVVDVRESISSAAARMAEARTSALPAVEGESLVGVVAAHHLATVKPEERDATPTRAVAATDVPRLHADEPLNTALERMAERHTEEAPVLEQGRLVGVLDASDLGRVLRVRELMSRSARSGAHARGQPQGSSFHVPESGDVIPLRPRRPQES